MVQAGEKSKAQLKREKKATKEAEELAAMEKEANTYPAAPLPALMHCADSWRWQAEKAGTEGVAAMERAALNDKLASAGRAVKDVPANGHCMFLSVVDQLDATGRQNHPPACGTSSPQPCVSASARWCYGLSFFCERPLVPAC
jgi:hypothetical protein